MSARKLRSIARSLTILGLETDKVPSESEFRRAYKDLFHLHPDKAGADSTAKFQEITEAATDVFEFLTENGNLKSDNADGDILADLVKNYNLEYKQKCVTFEVTPDTVDAWMSEFDALLGKSKPLPKTDNAIQYKKDSWSLECDSSSSLTTFGSISIRFFSTTFKVVVEGSSWLNFTTFALPQIVERMKRSKEVPGTLVTEETEIFFDAATIAAQTNNENGNILVEGFKRMENAVVALRTELTKKVDESVSNAAEDNENKKLDSISKKLDKLDSLLEGNRTELTAISDKLTIIAEKNNVVKLEPSDVQEIATAVSDSKKTELDEIASAIKEVKDNMDDKKLDDVVRSNKMVLEKLDGVKELSDAYTKGLDKLQDIFEKERDVATNSEKSVCVLNSMDGHMKALLAKFDAVPPTATANNTAAKEQTVETTIDDKDERSDDKIRKGKLFSSSIALGCDKETLERELNCKLEVIETYHIIENKTARNPDKYLSNMLKNHLKAGEVDFIVISVGSNDITFLDVDEDVRKLNKDALGHTAVLVDLAEKTAETLGIDVFITVRPARYDTKDKDPKAVKESLNQSANGMLVALASVLENVHTVKLSAFENLSDKAKKSLYKNDGVHLTKNGIAVLEDNLSKSTKTIYTDTEEKTVHTERYSSPASSQRVRGDAGNERTVEPRNAGRGYGRHWEGDRRDGGRSPHFRHDRGQYPEQPRGQHRNNRGGNWRQNRQEPDMQDMVRNFMEYMDSGRYRGGGVIY